MSADTLRIAMILDAWDQPANGLVVSTRRFVDALRERGHHITVFATGRPEDDKVVMPELRLPVFQRKIDAMGFPLARPDEEQLRRHLPGHDVAHVLFPFWLGHSGLRIARRLGLPVISSSHLQPENMWRNVGLDSKTLTRWAYRWFIRSVYQPSDRVICPSNLAAHLLRRHGLTREIDVISNGVPDGFLDLGRHRRPRPPGGEIVILCVGRLAGEKGQHTVIEAVSRCRHRDRIRLVLAGRGPEQAALVREAERLTLPARIGPVSDTELKHLYARADLFVQASGVELESMSTLEAMAAGCPALVADSPDSAASQFIDDDHWLFRHGDAAHLAHRIDACLDHPEAMATAGRHNHDVARQFSHAASVAAMERSYAAVLGQATDAAPVTESG